MESTLFCPKCGQLLSVSEELIGKEVMCSSCQQSFVAPSIATASASEDTSSTSCSPPPPRSPATIQANTPNLCPFCRQPLDICASACPHCARNVGMYNLQKRDPDSYTGGVVGAIIAVPLAYFIHRELIDASFHAATCCFYMAFVPIMIFLGYGVVGFWLGFAICKAFKSK